MKDMLCMIRVIVGFFATVVLFFAYFTFGEYATKSNFLALVYGIVCTVPFCAFVYYLEEDELIKEIGKVEE